VDDILAARDHLLAQRCACVWGVAHKVARMANSVFLHPKDFNGCLVELEQV
jgi:methylmalonyl-CoA/ethylmalonyl-CoA epimerase